MVGVQLGLAEQRRGPVSAGVRVGACLLAVALALSLAAGTAAGQDDTTAPSVAGVSAEGDTITITWTEPIAAGDWQSAHLTVTVGGVSQTIQGVVPASDQQSLVITLDSALPVGTTVVVSYDKDQTPDSAQVRDGAGNRLESFGNNVVSVASAQQVYDALNSYFSGAGTLPDTEAFVSNYYQNLLEKVAAGELGAIFDLAQRTAWGTDTSNNWYQVGSPNRIGSSATCGGQTQPKLQGDDRIRFFWACTGHPSQPNSQWVPVKQPQPGIDYTPDHQQVRPGDAGYNEDCRYRDGQGNPAPIFIADFHPQDHPNPQLRGKPIRNPDGTVQGTTIHGGNWDPQANICRGRASR